MGRPKSRAEELLSSTESCVGTKEAAAMLGVSVSSVQKLVEAGRLRAWRTQGGHRRIAEADVRAMGRDRAVAGGTHPLAVLIVEDNPSMRRAYAKMAERWGDRLDIAFANDAAAALLDIARRRPDVVVTDLVMQPFDGFHLIRTLRATPDLADTRILVVTGLDEAEIARMGGLDALSLCYRKPLSLERFAGYIDARIQDRLHQG